MHETYVTDETWTFDCNRCGHQWSVGYEVRHAQPVDGGERRLWRRNGLPSMAPEAGIPCPRCGDELRVTASRPNPPAVRQA